MEKKVKKAKLTYKEKEVAKWNTTDFHAYLTDLTADKFGVTYVPFGKGSTNQKWIVEKSLIKRLVAKEGAEVVKAFIDYCVDNYRPTEKYPYIAFGFMHTYMMTDIAKVQLSLRKQSQQVATIKREKEVDDTWF